MSQPILSILIPSTHDRERMLDSLLLEIKNQTERLGVEDKVEVLTEIDNRELPTGTKRNILLQRATGLYTVFIDSDDEIYEWYIEEILKAAETDCDVMATNGIMRTDGKREEKWYISKDHPYKAHVGPDGKTYYTRYSNHITPIRASIAKQIKFPDIVFGEDWKWATDLKNSGLLKTETIIHRPMYRYLFISNK